MVAVAVATPTAMATAAEQTQPTHQRARQCAGKHPRQRANQRANQRTRRDDTNACGEDHDNTSTSKHFAARRLAGGLAGSSAPERCCPHLLSACDGRVTQRLYALDGDQHSGPGRTGWCADSGATYGSCSSARCTGKDSRACDDTCSGTNDDTCSNDDTPSGDDGRSSDGSDSPHGYTRELYSRCCTCCRARRA